MSKQPTALFVVIADVFPLYISGIKNSFKHKNYIQPVAATNLQEILGNLENKKSQYVLLTDSFLAEFGGNCITEILQKYEAAKIIVLTHARQAHLLKNLISSGASAIVNKCTKGSEIEEALFQIQKNNDPFYAPEILKRLASKSEIPEYINRKKISLSDQQLKVLLLLLDGLTNKLIGVALDLEEETVKGYHKKINAKIKLSGCTCMFEYAFTMGYITMEKFAKKNLI